MNRFSEVVWMMAMGALLVLGGTSYARQDSDLKPDPDQQVRESDPKAVAMAHQCMNAMGGAEAWETTRYFRWTFFGNSRTHYWDKHTGRARVEMHSRDDSPDTIVLFNVNSQEGTSYVGTEPITDAQENERNLKRAYGAWINDGYWLFMPYKLTDPGVTLKDLGGQRLEDGRLVQRLELTFDSVGLTPQNKYHVDVIRETGLVAQWSFFPTTDTVEPRFTMPWANWQWHGPIMLSDDRGNGRALTNIAVYKHLPDSVFADPRPVDQSALQPLDLRPLESSDGN